MSSRINVNFREISTVGSRLINLLQTILMVDVDPSLKREITILLPYIVRGNLYVFCPEDNTSSVYSVYGDTFANDNVREKSSFLKKFESVWGPKFENFSGNTCSIPPPYFYSDHVNMCPSNSLYTPKNVYESLSRSHSRFLSSSPSLHIQTPSCSVVPCSSFSFRTQHTILSHNQTMNGLASSRFVSTSVMPNSIIASASTSPASIALSVLEVCGEEDMCGEEDANKERNKDDGGKKIMSKGGNGNGGGDMSMEFYSPPLRSPSCFPLLQQQSHPHKPAHLRRQTCYPLRIGCDIGIETPFGTFIPPPPLSTSAPSSPPNPGTCMSSCTPMLVVPSASVFLPLSQRSLSSSPALPRLHRRRTNKDKCRCIAKRGGRNWDHRDESVNRSKDKDTRVDRKKGKGVDMNRGRCEGNGRSWHRHSFSHTLIRHNITNNNNDNNDNYEFKYKKLGYSKHRQGRESSSFSSLTSSPSSSPSSSPLSSASFSSSSFSTPSPTLSSPHPNVAFNAIACPAPGDLHCDYCPSNNTLQLLCAAPSLQPLSLSLPVLPVVLSPARYAASSMLEEDSSSPHPHRSLPCSPFTCTSLLCSSRDHSPLSTSRASAMSVRVLEVRVGMRADEGERSMGGGTDVSSERSANACADCDACVNGNRDGGVDASVGVDAGVDIDADVGVDAGVGIDTSMGRGVGNDGIELKGDEKKKKEMKMAKRERKNQTIGEQKEVKGEKKDGVNKDGKEREGKGERRRKIKTKTKEFAKKNKKEKKKEKEKEKEEKRKDKRSGNGKKDVEKKLTSKPLLRSCSDCFSDDNSILCGIEPLFTHAPDLAMYRTWVRGVLQRENNKEKKRRRKDNEKKPASMSPLRTEARVVVGNNESGLTLKTTTPAHTPTATAHIRNPGVIARSTKRHKHQQEQKAVGRGLVQGRGLLFEMTRVERTQLGFALNDMSSLVFDSLLVDRLTHGNALVVVAFVVFQTHGLFAEFDIALQSFLNFFWLMQSSYLNNPFHTHVQAADALQMAHYAAIRLRSSSPYTHTHTLPSSAHSRASSLYTHTHTLPPSAHSRASSLYTHTHTLPPSAYSCPSSPSVQSLDTHHAQTYTQTLATPSNYYSSSSSSSSGPHPHATHTHNHAHLPSSSSSLLFPSRPLSACFHPHPHSHFHSHSHLHSLRDDGREEQACSACSCADKRDCDCNCPHHCCHSSSPTYSSPLNSHMLYYSSSSRGDFHSHSHSHSHSHFRTAPMLAISTFPSAIRPTSLYPSPPTPSSSSLQPSSPPQFPFPSRPSSSSQLGSCYPSRVQSSYRHTHTDASTLDGLSLLSLFFAAAALNAGHPGVSNEFLDAVGHEYAHVYNGRQPLECLHAASVFLIIRQYPSADVLKGLTGEERALLRENLRDAIIATDERRTCLLRSELEQRIKAKSTAWYYPSQNYPSQNYPSQNSPPQNYSPQTNHSNENNDQCNEKESNNNSNSRNNLHTTTTHPYSHTNNVCDDCDGNNNKNNNNDNNNNTTGNDGGDVDDHRPPHRDSRDRFHVESDLALFCAQDKLFLLKTLLCVSDLAPFCRPVSISRVWTMRGNEELFLQGDEEKRLRLPWSYCHNRVGVTPRILAISAVCYLGAIVLPLVSAASVFLDGFLEPCVNNVLKSIMYWNCVSNETMDFPNSENDVDVSFSLSRFHFPLSLLHLHLKDNEFHK